MKYDLREGIHAIQWTGRNYPEVHKFLLDYASPQARWRTIEAVEGERLFLWQRPEETASMKPGWWIVRMPCYLLWCMSDAEFQRHLVPMDKETEEKKRRRRYL